MIEIKDKKDCCGCWACENACPKHCISMVEDKEGFRYPQVDRICAEVRGRALTFYLFFASG